MTSTGGTLTAASRQWSERPPDERYGSLEELHAATTKYRKAAREAADVPYSTLRVAADGEDVKLVGKANVPSSLTHWSFGQLASAVGAPAGYLRELPPTLAVQNLNHGLAKRGEEGDTTNLLLHQNGGFVVRAALSDRYVRIWNNDITARLLAMRETAPEWQPAPPAFDGSRGLYASTQDMFAFMVDNERRIFEKAEGGGLSRGFFVSNSEVGAASFRITSFLYEYVCGNHIVWGASGVKEFILRHTGSADERAFRALTYELREYADASAAEDEAAIVRAQGTVLGKDKDEVLDRVFGLRIAGLSRRLLGEGYDKAEQRVDWYGNPRSLWGMVNGITEVARDMQHTDARVMVDRAAGKLMQVAF